MPPAYFDQVQLAIAKHTQLLLQQQQDSNTLIYAGKSSLTLLYKTMPSMYIAGIYKHHLRLIYNLMTRSLILEMIWWIILNFTYTNQNYY